MTRFTGDMADVAEICGADVAEAVLETLPGLNVYIPLKRQENGLIAKLDEAIAERLIQHFGGDRIYVSDPSKPVASKRAQVKDMAEAGLTVQEIALELGITERRVYQLRQLIGLEGVAPKQKRNDPRQIDLFDQAASPDQGEAA